MSKDVTYLRAEACIRNPSITEILDGRERVFVYLIFEGGNVNPSSVDMYWQGVETHDVGPTLPRVREQARMMRVLCQAYAVKNDLNMRYMGCVPLPWKERG